MLEGEIRMLEEISHVGWKSACWRDISVAGARFRKIVLESGYIGRHSKTTVSRL